MKIKLSREKQIFSVFILIFSLLSVRLYFLQVKPVEKVTAQYKNHQTENISDINYMVLDSKGKDLFKYNKEYVLVIDAKPFSLNNYEETLEDLIALNFIMKGENIDFNYTDVMKNKGKLYYKISESTFNKIKRLNNIKGIYTYVYDKVDKKEAWSTSGMLSNIGQNKSVKDSFEDKLYNELKNNESPKKNFYLDDSAVYNHEEIDIKKENKNLKLTIDKELDDKIRTVLSKEEFSKYKNVGVILLESNTGKIRSMVQKDESYANINLGIEGQGFEPGSIFKLVTYATALEKAILSPQNTYVCTGAVCKNAHGRLTVNDALTISCNDIFGIIGNEIGYQNMVDYCKRLGLYDRVLNLQTENKNETLGVMPKEDDGMNNFAIGQCMTVSPLQIIGAVNAVINNGVYVKPYLISEIIDSNEKTVKEFKTTSEKIFSKTTSEIVRDGMKNVVKKGTGVQAKIEGIEIGGKTGSSTSSDYTTHSWFLGTFNINGSTHTMLVFIPNLKSEKGEEVGGGNTAAPIFREIVKEINKK